MATTQNTYTGNNSTTDYSFTFPYIKEADVKVSLDAVDKTQDTDYTFANATTISFDTAPGTGVAIRIYRDTDLENAVTTFFAGSAIRAEDLNDNTNQVLFSAQERKNRDADKTGDTFTGDVTLNAANVVFEGATADDFETTLTATDPTADRTITLPNVTGTVVTTGDTGTVTSTMITDGTIVNADINTSAEIAVSKLGNGSARQVLQTSANGNEVEFTDNVDLPGTLDVTGNATFDASVTAGTFTGNLTGNAGTATTLQTARNIGGVSFDGSADINLPGVNTAGNQNTSGNAATATALQTARNIAGKSFDGTADITIAPTDLTGVNATATEINQLDDVTLIPGTPTWTSTTEIPSNSQISDRIAELGGFEAIATEDDFPATAPPEGVVVSIGNANALSVNASGVGAGTRAGGSDAVVINGFPPEFNSTTLDNGIGLLVVATSTAHTYDFHRVVAKNEDVRQLSSDIDDFKARYRVGATVPTTGLCGLDGTGTGSRPCNGDLFYNTASNTLLVYDANGNTTDTDSAVQALFTEVQSVGEYFIIPASELADFADGSASVEDISNAPNNAEQIILSINGVIQEPNAGTGVPTDGFSLNGATIQLAVAPPNPSEVWGVIIGSTVNINEPSNNSVSTAKIQDDAVEYAKMQNIATANRVLGSTTAGGIVSEVQVQTDMIADDAVTYAKMQHTANANRVLGAASAGAIGETQVLQGMIEDEAINEAKLQVSNAPTNGFFLSAQSGNTGGLTWAQATSATPNLDDVTDEGATTTNAITVGGVDIDLTGAANGSTTEGLEIDNDNSNSNDNLVTRIRFSRSGNSASNVYTALDSIRTGTHDTDFGISLNNGNVLTERFRFDSLGRFIINQSDFTGINTEADNFVIHGDHPTGMTILSGNGGNCNINFADDGDDDVGRIRYNHSSNRFEFTTNGTHHWNISSDGNIQSTSLSTGSSSGLGAELSDNGILTIQRASGNGGNIVFQAFQGTTKNVEMLANGTCSKPGGGSWTNINSERRLKQNLTLVDTTSAWDTVKTLPCYSYEYISQPGITYYGPVVDECPTEMQVTVYEEDENGELVVRADEEGPLRTYDNKLYDANMFVALQEALKRIETLETKIAALEGGE